MKMPETFPFDTMTVMAFLRLVKDQNGARLEPLIDTFFNRIWRQGQSLATPAEIEAAASPLFKGDESLLRKLIDECQTRETRMLLSKEGERMVKEGGMFGGPCVSRTDYC